MTVCADQPRTAAGAVARVGARAAADVLAGVPGCRPLTIAADGSYGARLVVRGPGPDGRTGWCPERWTLDGPEPYSVPLPGSRPEDPAGELQPLADGRVLISRPADDGFSFALLYPSGPDTGELALGSVECGQLSLLPPAPDGSRVYALVPGDGATVLWQVCGGAFGPEPVARIPGRCSGGAWLDRQGRLLALDRTDVEGRTRTVTLDVRHGGTPATLLQIAEGSNDRLLLADPDSGLLLVRSDAPGEDRVGWGVLGSHRPVRFPEALHPEGVRLVPFAVQPDQVLLPETCAVALLAEGPGGTRIVAWRPQQREVQPVAAPEGWLTGAGRWTPGGELLLPFSSADTPCGVARVPVPVPVPRPRPRPLRSFRGGELPAPGPAADTAAVAGVCRPVPLQQAPLAGKG
ncbi:hypothetical protein PJ985_09490 [Streptomyces sp. ACA25]|nr:hypothetical protein [Streptomyces sp. ACA25]MDB1087796.1 hypothetical protein [Streptomyces sp. ACA25]